MDKVNKDGKTLEEFLADYTPGLWAKPFYTADTVLFSVKDNKPVVLLVQRGNHPHIFDWAFPGGFVSEGESSETAAVRELKEETSIDAPKNLEQLVTVSTPHRDVRGWTVTTCFFAVMPEPIAATGLDDAADAKWFSIDYAAKNDLYELILKSVDDDADSQPITLRAEMKIARNFSGAIDLNKSIILNQEGLAFDHAKLILYAIEKL